MNIMLFILINYGLCIKNFSGDELLLTELLFNGVFNTLTPEEVCALLSCLVYKEGSCDRPNLSEPMLEILKQIQVSFCCAVQIFSTSFLI